MAALSVVSWGAVWLGASGYFGSFSNPVPTSIPDWPQVWRQVAEVEALDATDPARRGRLSELAGEPLVQEASPRGALLRATLARLQERKAIWTPPAGGLGTFDAEECWLAAAVLAPGLDQRRAAIQALGPLEIAAAAPVLAPARTDLAFRVWVEAAEALDFDSALALGRNLHLRQRATWSAVSLCLTLMRAGLHEEADQMLAEQIAAAASSIDLALLWDHRGIAALGAGWDLRARAALGQSLLHGSHDAAAVLARMDLSAGRLSEARVGFRAVLLENPDHEWARRGWGLALLPLTSTNVRPRPTVW